MNEPNQEQECAICHRVTEDGQVVDVCDESRDEMERKGWRRIPENGDRFFCQDCADDLVRGRTPAIDAGAWNYLVGMLDLSVYTHPMRLAEVIAQAVQERDAAKSALVERRVAVPGLSGDDVAQILAVCGLSASERVERAYALAALRAALQADTTSQKEDPCA